MILSDIDRIADEYGFTHAADQRVSRPLKSALNSLVNNDSMLISRGAAERSICHRLAVYLEQEVNQGVDKQSRWQVDCEYNLLGSSDAERDRLGELRKSLRVEGLADASGADEDHSVYPDIIVHRRGTKDNLLIIEAKVHRPSTRREAIKFDFRKLRKFQEKDSGFAYREAVFVVFLPGNINSEESSTKYLTYTNSP